MASGFKPPPPPPPGPGASGAAAGAPRNPIDSKTGAPLNLPPTYQSPVRLLKGALISYDPDTQKTISRIPFQYNPEKLSRDLTPKTYTGKQGKDLIGAPDQTISTTIKLQAVDHMIVTKGAYQAGLGLYRRLAALELLIYPKSSMIKDYRSKLQAGTKGAVPPSAYPVLFQWGPRRLLPVRLTSLKVTETLFNIALSPIAAEVVVSMTVERIVEASGMAYDLLNLNLEDLEGLARTEYQAGPSNWRERGGY